MVVFYRGLWCDYCREQLDELANATARFTQRGVKVVAISTDATDDIKAMLERTRCSFPILSDSTGDLVRELDLVDPFEFRTTPVSLPAVFLIDGTGVVRFHYVGRSPDDRPRLELLLLAAESLSMEKR